MPSWTKIALAALAFIVTTMPVLVSALRARQTRGRWAPALVTYEELAKENPEEPGVCVEPTLPDQPEPLELAAYYRRRDVWDAWTERVEQADAQFGFKRDDVLEAAPSELAGKRADWEGDLQKLMDSGLWIIAGAALAAVEAFTK